MSLLVIGRSELCTQERLKGLSAGIINIRTVNAASVDWLREQAQGVRIAHNLRNVGASRGGTKTAQPLSSDKTGL